MEISGAFERAKQKLDAELKTLLAAGDELVSTIGQIAVLPDAPDTADRLSAIDDARKALLDKQKAVHDRLAKAVARISSFIDEEKLSFDRREMPLRSDMLIGFLSKNTMRKRIKARAFRFGKVERLRISLGRADRLAGLMDAHRHGVMAQRKMGEALLADIPRWREEQRGSGDNAGGPAYHMASPVAAIVDALNIAVRDLTLLLQKLAFDVERLLDHYLVLLSFRKDREAHLLVPAAYPYFHMAVGRLVDETLPGARLAGIRQRVNVAFADRFAAL